MAPSCCSKSGDRTAQSLFDCALVYFNRAKISYWDASLRRLPLSKAQMTRDAMPRQACGGHVQYDSADELLKLKGTSCPY